MELRQLCYFLTLGREKSFTRAARILEVSQPTITYAIHNLEEEFGVSLCKRRRTGIVMTEAGELLLQCANRIMSEVEETQNAMEKLIQNAGREFRIGLTPDSDRDVSSLLLDTVRAFYPEVHVTVSLKPADELVSAIESEKLNCGLVTVPEPFADRGSLVHYKICGESLVALQPDQQNPEEPGVLDLAELSKTQVYFFQQDISAKKVFLQLAEQKKLKFEAITVDAPDAGAFFAILEQCNGVSIVSEKVLRTGGHSALKRRELMPAVMCNTVLLSSESCIQIEWVEKLAHHLCEIFSNRVTTI